MKFLLFFFSLVTSLNLFSQNSVTIMPKIEFSKETIYVKSTDITKDTLEVEFSVKNTGGSTLQIFEVKPSCGCTVVNFQSEIPSNTESTITLKISRPTPPFTKSVFVRSNDPERPDVILMVKSEI